MQSVVNYLTKYASKAEQASGSITQIRDMISSILTANRDSVSFVQSVLIRQASLRDYSAQEAIWILMSFPFYSSSRLFVTINLKEDSFVFINEEDDNSPNDPQSVYANRMNYELPNYLLRENNQELSILQNISLYDFFSAFHLNPNNRNKLQRYRKTSILRVFPRLLLTNARNELNENFCKLQVKLHVPWTNFENDLNSDRLPWSEIYRNHSDVMPNFINLDLIQPEEEEFDDIDLNDHDLDLEEWMIALRQVPNRDLPQAELGLREQDTIFDWHASFHTYDQLQQVAQFVQQNLNETNVNIEPEMPNILFSSEQNRVISFIQRGIEFVQNDSNQRIIKSMIVQGKAGSGKSTVIQAAQALCYRGLGSKSYITLANTGSAASLINGHTIHSKLMINIDKKLRTLSPSELNRLQQDLKDCFFVIIDEFSLIGCSLLLGDIKQLPPVKDRPFYGKGFNNLEGVEMGQQLYKSIESAVILPSSFRQNEREVMFRNILDRISNGELTHTDWVQINSRRMAAINANMFAESIRLYATNAKVHEYNEHRLRTFCHVYRVKAINNCSEASKARAKDADNLENVLHLAIGARIMLRKNLSTSHGLTNGSLRTVTDIVVSEDSEMPLFVLVRFDR